MDKFNLRFESTEARTKMLRAIEKYNEQAHPNWVLIVGIQANSTVDLVIWSHPVSLSWLMLLFMGNHFDFKLLPPSMAPFNLLLK